MKFNVWLKDHKEETIKVIDVPLKTYDGVKEKRPSPISVKDHACKSGAFHWAEYPNLRLKKL